MTRGGDGERGATCNSGEGDRGGEGDGLRGFADLLAERLGGPKRMGGFAEPREIV